MYDDVREANEQDEPKHSHHHEESRLCKMPRTGWMQACTVQVKGAVCSVQGVGSGCSVPACAGCREYVMEYVGSRVQWLGYSGAHKEKGSRTRVPAEHRAEQPTTWLGFGTLGRGGGWAGLASLPSSDELSKASRTGGEPRRGEHI